MDPDPAMLAPPKKRTRLRKFAFSIPLSVIRCMNGYFLFHIYLIIKTIYLLPIYLYNINKEKTNVLILGAFGCGAFSPSNNLQNYVGIKYNEYIAYIFASILLKIPSILSTYDFICFAIPPGDNYNIFKKVFLKYNLI